MVYPLRAAQLRNAGASRRGRDSDALMISTRRRASACNAAVSALAERNVAASGQAAPLGTRGEPQASDNGTARSRSRRWSLTLQFDAKQ